MSTRLRQMLWSVVTWGLFWAIYGVLRGGVRLLAGGTWFEFLWNLGSGMIAGAFFGAIFGFFGMTGDKPAIYLLLPKLPGVILGGLLFGLLAFQFKWWQWVGPLIVVGMFLGAYLWDKAFSLRRPSHEATAEPKAKGKKK
ncbi:MAG: hypothetical protein JW726_16455 [Anaerolineales bacterium]|nr:hypothetical protein [Anaerolineales bacterium]